MSITFGSREIRTVAFVQCEICGKSSHGKNWPKSSIYDEREVNIAFVDGKDYPDDKCGEVYILDICPTCFMEKLVPWFEGQGGEVRKVRLEEYGLEKRP